MKDELQHNGFVIADFLDENELKALRQVFDSQPVERNSMAYFATPLSDDYAYRKSIHEGIVAVIERKLKQLRPGYRISSAGFLARPAEDQTMRIPLHRDFTFVDPAKHIAYHAVIPLNDTEDSFTAIIGSHNWPHIAAVGFNPNPWDDHATTLEKYLCRPLKIKAGQICLYDERLLVSTAPNKSGRDRLTAAASLLPDGVEATVYSYDGDIPQQLKVFSASDEFFLQYNPLAPLTRPYLNSLKEIAAQPFQALTMSAEQVEALCRSVKAQA